MKKRLLCLVLIPLLAVVSCENTANRSGDDRGESDKFPTEQSVGETEISLEIAEDDKQENIQISISPSSKKLVYGESVTFKAEFLGEPEDADDLTYQWYVRSPKAYFGSDGAFHEAFCLPMMIERSRFEKEILGKMPQGMKDAKLGHEPYKYIDAYYVLKDPDSVSGTESEDMKKKFPITEKYAVYILADATIHREKRNLHHLITTYTDYSYDDLHYDHELVGYEYGDTNEGDFVEDTDVWLPVTEGGYALKGGNSPEITVTPIRDVENDVELRCIATDYAGEKYYSTPVSYTFSPSENGDAQVAARVEAVTRRDDGYTLDLRAEVRDRYDLDYYYDVMWQIKNDRFEETRFAIDHTPDENDSEWYEYHYYSELMSSRFFRDGAETETEIRCKFSEYSYNVVEGKKEYTGNVYFSDIIKVSDVIEYVTGGS